MTIFYFRFSIEMEPLILRIYTELGFGSTGVGFFFFVWLIGVLGLGWRVSGLGGLRGSQKVEGISSVEIGAAVEIVRDAVAFCLTGGGGEG